MSTSLTAATIASSNGQMCRRVAVSSRKNCNWRTLQYSAIGISTSTVTAKWVESIVRRRSMNSRLKKKSFFSDENIPIRGRRIRFTEIRCEHRYASASVLQRRQDSFDGEDEIFVRESSERWSNRFGVSKNVRFISATDFEFDYAKSGSNRRQSVLRVWHSKWAELQSRLRANCCHWCCRRRGIHGPQAKYNYRNCFA